MKITRESRVDRTPRVIQLESMFDLPSEEKNRVEWDVSIDLDFDWNIGLIVGPSGSGKTTVARELFGDSIYSGHEWKSQQAVIDGFSSDLSIKEVTKLLGSVGFNSPPNWLRPYHVLSNGEKFRVDIARSLSIPSDLVVVDEFTSVVDRQVAKIASYSVQKAVRKNKKKFIAISCHYDIIDWLQPDWIYEPETGVFQRGLERRRPEIEISVKQCDRGLWKNFSKYHYLSGNILTSAKCFAAYIGARPIAFIAYRHLPHGKTKNIKMGHRLVVHPDYQGLGIGGILDNWLGEYLYRRGFRYHNTTAHPGMIAFYLKSPRWVKIRSGTQSTGGKVKTSNKTSVKTLAALKKNHLMMSAQRSTYSFCYKPPIKPYENIRFL